MSFKKLGCLFFILCFSVGTAWATTPDEVVKETAEGVISHIESNRSILETHPEKIYDMVNELVIPRFENLLHSLKHYLYVLMPERYWSTLDRV